MAASMPTREARAIPLATSTAAVAAIRAPIVSTRTERPAMPSRAVAVTKAVVTPAMAEWPMTSETRDCLCRYR